MASFRLEYTFDDGSLVEIDGPRVKFWIGEGLPDFVGDLDDFSTRFPVHFNVLLNEKILIPTKWST